MARLLAGVGFVFCLVLHLCQARAVAESGPPVLKPRNPQELVSMISKLSLEDLRRLDSVELNFLKNAVFASHGFDFADDRWYLTEYFYGDEYLHAKDLDSDGKEVWSRQVRASSDENTRVELQRQRWTNALAAPERDKCASSLRMDLKEVVFPHPATIRFSMTREMKAALSVIMEAIFQRAATMGFLSLDAAEHLYTGPERLRGLCLLGRTTAAILQPRAEDPKSLSYIHNGEESPERLNDAVRSELMAYAQMFEMLSDVHGGNFAFEQGDFLGFFLGSIDLFHAMLRQMAGESVPEELLPQTRAVRKRLRIPEPVFPMTPVNQARLRQLIALVNVVGKSILASDIGDLPEELKAKKIELDGSLGFYDGC